MVNEEEDAIEKVLSQFESIKDELLFRCDYRVLGHMQLLDRCISLLEDRPHVEIKDNQNLTQMLKLIDIQSMDIVDEINSIDEDTKSAINKFESFYRWFKAVIGDGESQFQSRRLKDNFLKVYPEAKNYKFEHKAFMEEKEDIAKRMRELSLEMRGIVIETLVAKEELIEKAKIIDAVNDGLTKICTDNN